MPCIVITGPILVGTDTVHGPSAHGPETGSRKLPPREGAARLSLRTGLFRNPFRGHSPTGPLQLGPAVRVTGTSCRQRAVPHATTSMDKAPFSPKKTPSSSDGHVAPIYRYLRASRRSSTKIYEASSMLRPDTCILRTEPGALEVAASVAARG